MALLATSVCAYADFIPSVEPTTPVRSIVTPSGEELIGRDWIDNGLTGLVEVSVPRHSAVDTPTNVIELPASPGSMGLFLSGALSIGAWHLVRSARNLHFADLPEWYHAGAPEQIGYTVAFDLDLTMQPLCEVLQPVFDERPLFFGHGPDEQRPRDVQFFSIVTSRGPPCCV